MQERDDHLPDLIQNVERLLGRCVLRLQQYERLIKTLLAHSEIEGPISQWQARRDVSVAEVSRRTLGDLAKRLLESFVVPMGFEPRTTKTPVVSADHVSMAIRVRMELTDEDHASVKSALELLVSMRNELVHTFIQRFDLRTVESCSAAVDHLAVFCERIDHHIAEVQHWLNTMVGAHASLTSVLQNSVVDDFFNGIAPDGTIDWEYSGIVRALRQATQSLASLDWVRLEDAIAWMTEHHPTQIPGRYGCRTWQQLLHESRAFRMEYRPDEQLSRVLWFCEKQ
ncbi:OST-HTH/LOTUS domain-containing protein [Rhizobacter sp. Root404]|uniref:OST-HTH/LOTUS domain-containing protein n=1 Tax=Rhizobacter sp. Root404 TaxID=1736528 RepID=UPI00070210DD|nr:OST-HTH/LOTUS domain-containing protein [Rhizobacter sp. Root404]KQW37770.1 hypothetical protein ASC76_06655 [Rhizobacter sp. Root404]